MEQWRDQGIVLSARTHGESGSIVSLLTERYGRHAGYLRGGQGSKNRALVQAGNLVTANWASRADHGLGYYSLEAERPVAAMLMDDALKLGAMQSACALCDAALPEREAHAALFHGLVALGEAMQGEVWAEIYIIWELAFLRELGYGIELTRCAQGGDPATLEWVSPRSGCAVSAAAGEPYKDRLLKLPAFLRPGRGAGGAEDVLDGLKLTGYFLEHRIFAQLTSGIPVERLRFMERFARKFDAMAVIPTAPVGMTQGD